MNENNKKKKSIKGNKENTTIIETNINKEKTNIKENLIEEKECKTKEEINSVSLKEIKEKLGNKVNTEQKRNIIKEIITNAITAIVIILYLFIIFISHQKISKEIIAIILKVISIVIAILGIGVLEIAYKKDKVKIAINSIEIITFAIINLCLVYIIKIYFEKLVTVLIYIAIVSTTYYFFKTLFLSIKNIKIYKKDNNDIKEIIKK